MSRVPSQPPPPMTASLRPATYMRRTGLRPAVQQLVTDAMRATVSISRNSRLLSCAAALLRPPAGTEPLSLEEIDALEEAFSGGGLFYTVYGVDPPPVPTACKIPGIFVAISDEECEALAQYIRLIGGRKVVEVACGDGRLAAALQPRLKQNGATITASDPGLWQITRDPHVLSLTAIETLNRINPDVMIVSWVAPATNVDFELAQYASNHPEATLIIIGAQTDTGSARFFGEVLCRHPWGDTYLYSQQTISLPLQHKEPKSLNQVIGRDGRSYVLNRSRRKICGETEGGYIMVLRSPSSPKIPDGNPLHTDYLPPARYQINS